MIPARMLAWLPFRRFREPPPVVAVVPLNGIIGRFEPWRRGLSLASLSGVLDRAFGLDNLKAVAITVNSPGGAPVQSALIARRLRALAEEKQVPVFAFAEDVAASGGYWLLCAGDEIFVDACSIVGSIGVISAGFGFPDVLKRLGIERRVYAMGEHKDGLDPFQPEKPEEVELLRQVQADIFGAFCRHVEQRRAGKLTQAPEALFTGRVWSGERAVELGLADGLGDVRSVMRQRFGERVKLKLVSDGRRWWQRRLALRQRELAAESGARLLAALDEWLAWRRFGV